MYESLFVFQAITTPAMAVSHIMLEAYKKYILVSLILHGKVQQLPKYTSQIVGRFIKVSFCSNCTTSSWQVWSIVSDDHMVKLGLLFHPFYIQNILDGVYKFLQGSSFFPRSKAFKFGQLFSLSTGFRVNACFPFLCVWRRYMNRWRYSIVIGPFISRPFISSSTRIDLCLPESESELNTPKSDLWF